jgi:hypothetical protein
MFTAAKPSPGIRGFTIEVKKVSELIKKIVLLKNSKNKSNKKRKKE